MANSRQRLADVQNFMIYYGSGEKERLSEFKAVILEPRGHAPDEIADLKSKGVIVIAYFNVLELPYWHQARTFLKDEDYMEFQGIPLVNSQNGNGVIDIGSTRWQRYLMHEAGLLICNHGYDGLFLDTLGWVESPDVLSQYGQKYLYEMVRFLLELRNHFPEHIIIQNNALEHLGLLTVDLIDGFCWENPCLKGEKALLWNKAIIERLLHWRQEYHKTILLLCEATNIPSEDINMELTTSQLAQKYNFSFCYAGHDYLTIL